MPITVPKEAEINATAGYFFSSANPLNRPLVIFVSGGSVSLPFIKLRAWLRAKIPTITTNNTKKIDLGIVGLGILSQTVHLPSFYKNKNFKLRALCDHNRNLLNPISYKYNVKNTYTDINQMIKNEKLDNYKETDPIKIVKSEILKKKIASNDEIEKINKETLEEIKNAAEFATNSSFPKDSELYTDVYL